MLVGLVLAAVLVVLVGARVLQHRRRDEIRSIHHYHDRLDTLHVEPQDRGGSVRVVDEVPPPVEHAQPDRPRLDPGAAYLAPWDPTPTTAERDRRRRHDRAWALDRMQTRARIDTGTLLVVSIVVALLAAMALAGYLIQRDRGSGPTTTSTTSTTSPRALGPMPPARAGTAGSALASSARPSGSERGAARSGRGRETAQVTGSNLAVKWRSWGGASTIR